MSYWCELAWLGGDRPEEGVVIDVSGDRIASIMTGVESPPGDAEHLRGLTLPGLANAHSHAFHRALRGRAERGRGSFWTWREQMYELAARLDLDNYFDLARATFAEMALAGVTVVGEFHYLHHRAGGEPYDDPNAMGHVILQAAAEAGVRVTLLDACYLLGGIGQEPDGVQERFSDGSVEAWRRRVEAIPQSEAAKVGAAIHSVRAVDPDSARVVATWAAEHSRPLHAHVSEQPSENEDSIEAYGVTPTELLDREGALGKRFTAVHATHVTEPDVRLLGDRRACCCLCPTTERDLADGVGPARMLAELGASLSLGSDSHAVIDIFEEARAVELDERLVTGARGHHTAAELLRAATESGYRCLGWPDGGRIEEEALADLVTVGLDSVRLAGATPAEALEAVVFAGAAADVRHVIMGGRRIVWDGAHLALDVANELRHSIAAVTA
ncbi:MAG TPA: formimidoylglutamate deiminase [Thermoleophilaceae bacterium]